jgi:hypothetical protein
VRPPCCSLTIASNDRRELDAYSAVKEPALDRVSVLGIPSFKTRRVRKSKKKIRSRAFFQADNPLVLFPIGADCETLMAPTW